MKTLKLWLVGCLASGALSGSVNAANYAITAEITDAYDEDFNLLPNVPDISFNLGAPHIFALEFTLHADGFNAAENQRGFGNMLFDITFDGDSLGPTEDTFIVGWSPINPRVDTNGPEPGGNFDRWFANEDTGSSSTDLEDILIDLAVIPDPHPADPRPHVGEAPGTWIGSMFIEWDGIGPETLTVTSPITLSGPQISFARIDNGQTQQDVDAVFTGATITFGGMDPVSVPGDFDGDGDVDGADFVVWQTNFPTETEATLATGDADGDGDVDGADFVIWQTNFPTSASLAAAPVPEPHSILLVALGGLLALGYRRR